MRSISGFAGETEDWGYRWLAARGIPANLLDGIFDPELSGRGSRVHMGLGLPMSYSIIKQHMGELQIESDPGRGTMVTIALPVNLDIQVAS